MDGYKHLIDFYINVDTQDPRAKELSLMALQKALNKNPEIKTILDVGCGTGK